MGSFAAGALGGLGGAIAGNILYDQFGRPHHGGSPGVASPEHTAGGVFPPSQPNAPIEPPRETFDPNAGASADWGGDENQPAPDQWGGGEPANASGDWGGNEPDAGNWGGSDQGAEPSGDWGGDAGTPDDGGGGDWGGDAPDTPDQDQGGGW